MYIIYIYTFEVNALEEVFGFLLESMSAELQIINVVKYSLLYYPVHDKEDMYDTM